MVFYCLKLRRIQFSKPLKIILECIYYYYKKKLQNRFPCYLFFHFRVWKGIGKWPWKIRVSHDQDWAFAFWVWLHAQNRACNCLEVPLESIQTQGFGSMVLVRDRDWGVCSCKFSGSIFRPQGLTSIWTQGFGSMVLVRDRDWESLLS